MQSMLSLRDMKVGGDLMSKDKKEKNWQEQNPASLFCSLKMLYYHETGMSMTGFIII